MSTEDEQLGQRIRELREYIGYSQAEAAEALQVPRTAMVQVEKGARRVSSTELTKLARLFGCSTDDLLGITPQEDQDRVAVVARAAKDLRPEDLEEVVRFAKFLRMRNRSDP